MMKRILIALAAAVLAEPASAADDARGCFVRDYDRAHLAQHRDQLVTNVRLLVKSAAPGSADRFDFVLWLKKRGRPEALHTLGSCRETASGFRCSVECDGGGIDVGNRGAYVMMHLDRIRMGSCDVDPHDPLRSEDVTGGVDDFDFKMSRMSDATCADLR
jgi:hypothetical protein